MAQIQWSTTFRGVGAAVIAVMVLATGLPAWAVNHLIHITEVYSNEDGSIQFVELTADSVGQTSLTPTSVVAYNEDGSESTVVYDFTASFGALGAGESLLIATDTFEGEYGFAPDFEMTGSLYLGSGRVVFEHTSPCPGILDCEIDAIAYGDFTGDNGAFGDPAVALPDDGCTSLTRVAEDEDNSTDIEATEGTPENVDGDTTTMECAPPPVPMAPFITGDLSGDGAIGLNDAILQLEYMFLSGAISCEEAADFNDDGDILLDDPLAHLAYQFLSGEAPASPFPDCGKDDAYDFGCEESAACP